MRAAKLNSSAISRILYDDEARTLSIWFHGSGRYVYFDVPREAFDSLRTPRRPASISATRSKAAIAASPIPTASASARPTPRRAIGPHD